MTAQSVKQDVEALLSRWKSDPLKTRECFQAWYQWLAARPEVRLEFKARPGVSYSLRATHARQQERPLFVLLDVVDDEPEARWLSVCFYADMVSDPDGRGDFVPEGLMGRNACCLNLDEDDADMRDYILARIGEAADKAALG